ncbi:hypothetical protein H0H93_004957 [Arthromyces matolae]|nr:hypothetical protein H0H93_004957 [Arthromyces matolae]
MLLPSPSEKLEVPRAINPSPSLRKARSLVNLKPGPSYHDDAASSSSSPPAYNEKIRKPLAPVTYTFWPQIEIPNSMVLAPPIDISDAGPSYYISVKMNIFTPTSHITSIKRNSQDGDFVGDFE